MLSSSNIFQCEQKKWMKNIQLIGVIIFFTLLLIILVDPADIFIHGFFCEPIEYKQIEKEDFIGEINLNNQDYEMQFKPMKKYFRGFEINVTNLKKNSKGILYLTIYDDDKELEQTSVDVSKLSNKTWYRVYFHKTLTPGSLYTLHISADDCKNAPYLQLVDSDYLSEESMAGNLLIEYAYAESSFTFQEKILISLFMISFGAMIISMISEEQRQKKLTSRVAVFVFLACVLSWNYMYNSMDNQNAAAFEYFQQDSETLAVGVIEAEHNNVALHGYGLGRYTDTLGSYYYYGREFLTNADWTNGYSNSKTAILVNLNTFTESVSKVGNYIKFSNGDEYKIIDTEDDGTNITIYLSGSEKLNENKHGSLSDIVFYDKNHKPLPKGDLGSYISQFGLQGRFFRHFSHYMPYDEVIPNLHLLCSLLTGIVLTVIVFLLFYKFNILLSGIFYITFWLSPWIVNFARNIYWVEFTWFIPMAVGLFCAWKINSKKCRVFSYGMAYIAITGKCLCGYEYISVIMMGMISFLLIDFISAIAAKDKSKQKQLFNTIFIIGVVALAGFMTAICIHARLKGEGDILEGIKKIISQDVLKRTFGGDLNNFTESLWPSFNASIWETYCKYFHFSTEIITGIAGNLFPVLCIVPLGIFVYEFKKEKINNELSAMYIVFFITSVSWFILAKSHSYVHTHMNYVLWYFGFVQTCFYIIVNKAVGLLRKGNT